MNKYYLWAMMVFSFGYSTLAQNWVQKANYTGGTMDYGVVSFVIGGKGYVIGWANSYNDVREYDPVTNSWKKKTNFPGQLRAGAVGFSIGSKGYYGTGGGVTKLLKDWWEYNPITDTWKQKKDFPGVARRIANAFTIGNKGYIGIGFAGNIYHVNDFWEYDPVLDTFIRKANFPGIKRDRSVGFSILDKGYITSGQDTTSALLNDLWEYNPTSNIWNKRANFPSTVRAYPVCIGIGVKGYVGLGGNISLYYQDFWEYNPINNSWNQIANFGGVARWESFSFAIGLKLYVGAGHGASGDLFDFWEYTQPCTTPVVTSLSSNSTKCVGETYQFNDSITGSTPYTFQWYKDGIAISGATSKTYTTNKLKLSDSGSYTCIVSNLCSSDTSTPVKLSMVPLPVANFTVNDTVRCFKANEFKFTNNSTTTFGNLSYYWTFGDGATYSKKDTSHSYLAADSFFVKLKASLSPACYSEKVQKIKVLPHPQTNFTVNDSIQCLKGNSFSFTNTSAIKWGTMTYKWNLGDGTTPTNTNPVHSYVAAGSYTVALKAISDFGCSDSIKKSIIVKPSPVAAFDVQDSAQCLNKSFAFSNKSHIQTGTIVQNKWKFGDGQTATTLNSNHSYQNEGSYAVGLSVTSDLGCMDSIAKTIKAYPMPDASFTVNDSIQCLRGNSFSFDNTSTISSGSMNSLWKLSDGASSSLKNYQHSFSTSGKYNVKLLATSNYNCKDSLAQALYVNDNPVVDLGKDSSLTDKQNITLDAGAGMDDYEWSDGSKNRKLTIDTTGYGIGKHTIWVRVTKNGCTDEDSVIITFKKATGIANTVNDDVSLYPNPVSNELRLNYSGQKPFDIQIINSLGIVIKEQRNLTTKTNSFNLESLENGIYFIILKTDNSSLVRKFIKN